MNAPSAAESHDVASRPSGYGAKFEAYDPHGLHGFARLADPRSRRTRIRTRKSRPLCRVRE